MVNPQLEKNIIIGMIVSKRFLQEIIPIRKPLLVPFAETVAEWCIEYWEHYKKAPGKHIQDIYSTHSKEGLPEEQVDLIEAFLSNLSEEYKRAEKFNVNYVLDSAEKYFRKISLDELKNKLTTNLSVGKINKAENIIKNYKRIVRPETKGVSPFDEDIIKKAFSEDSGDKLFSFPKHLGSVIGTFEREELVAFVGKSGIGKTWWLLWTSLLALFEGYNVVFVSLEMSERQIIKRIHQYLNSRPIRKTKEIIIPYFDKEGDISHKRKHKRTLTESLSIKQTNRCIRTGSIKKDRYKLLFYPSNTCTMTQLETQIQNMEYYEGFIPDVIVTDYADKFKSEGYGDVRRHQLAQVWDSHKALAQKYKCLVVTASQSNTMRTGKDIKQGDWAESVSKIELCDIGIALNQQPEDKRKGVMRVGVLKQRHDDFDLLREVMVTQNYTIGRPYLDSYIERS